MPATRHQLHRVGFSPEQSEQLVKINDTTTTVTFEARTTVRVATAAGATVLPVGDAAAIAVGDEVVIARGTATEETRTVTAVDLTATANTITVAALANPHAIAEAVDERISTVTNTPPSVKALLRVGFTDDQARILRTSGRTRTQLIRQAKLTRAQAQLVLIP